MQDANFPCRLCGAEDLVLEYAQGNDGQFRYFRCENCRLVNLDLAAKLDQDQTNLIYRDPADDSSRKNRKLDATFRFIRRFVPNAASLCDIGCGNGRLLYLARKQGLNVFGLELTEPVARRASERLDVEIATSDFLEFDTPAQHANAYDIVCLRHVLEHLPDSRLAMRKIGELMKPNGYALLEFPNIDGLDKQLKRFIEARGLHRRQYRENFAPGLNWLYRLMPIGNKARALVQRVT